MPKPVSDQLPETQVSPNPQLEKRGRRVFAPEYKLRILAQADGCSHVVPVQKAPFSVSSVCCQQMPLSIMPESNLLQ